MAVEGFKFRTPLHDVGAQVPWSIRHWGQVRKSSSATLPFTGNSGAGFGPHLHDVSAGVPLGQVAVGVGRAVAALPDALAAALLALVVAGGAHPHQVVRREAHPAMLLKVLCNRRKLLRSHSQYRNQDSGLARAATCVAYTPVWLAAATLLTPVRSLGARVIKSTSSLASG